MNIAVIVLGVIVYLVIFGSVTAQIVLVALRVTWLVGHCLLAMAVYLISAMCRGWASLRAGKADRPATAPLGSEEPRR